jgi:hypothetical protein
MSARLSPLPGGARDHDTAAESAAARDRETRQNKARASCGVFVSKGAATFSQIQLFVRWPTVILR